jgi:CRISPR-associated protein Cmr4
MYKKAYGVIETLAPLHVGATAGEESGNLNLIFRDQFTQTGIIPGSSIRGRLRSDMRSSRQQCLEKAITNKGETIPIISNSDLESEKPITKLKLLEEKAKDLEISTPSDKDENLWYGHEAVSGESNKTTESLVKFEYASILWLPVFCPGQPIVWVSCPRLLKRYKRIAGDSVKSEIPTIYSGSRELEKNKHELKKNKLFFNFGFLTIDCPNQNLTEWFPDGKERPAVVVGDDEIAMIHDMALYRQTRIAMEKGQKVVQNFFGVEALPEETILVFPIAHRKDEKGQSWNPFIGKTDIYLGGLESIGFGHCELTLKEL